MLMTAVTMLRRPRSCDLGANDWSILSARWELLQIAQAGVAGAEVVDGHLHPFSLNVCRMAAADSNAS